MTKYGLIATQQGADIDNSPDYKQIFNSNWPILEIAHQEKISVSFETSSMKSIYHHGLGFKPAFSWMDSQGFSGVTGGDLGISADEQDVYCTGDTGDVITGMLIVYNYDPTIEFRAISQPTGSGTAKSPYGLKVLRDGGDIDSRDYSKFSLHTKAKSLTIHQSGIVSASEGSNFTATIRHFLDYLPSYMIFRIGGDGFGINGHLSAGVPARPFGDKTTLSFVGVQSVLIGNFAYIVFKDPLLETSS